MKAYKSFEEFKTYADEIAKTYEFVISSYNEDYSIDIDKYININVRTLTELPIKFNKVTGPFICSNNKLTSLKGCPEYVGEDFWCHGNKLKSLEGCPKYVGGDFLCYQNKLTSLKCCPEIINGNFYCADNQLTSLKYAPKVIRRDWNIERKFHSYPEYQKYLLVKKIEKL